MHILRRKQTREDALEARKETQEEYTDPTAQAQEESNVEGRGPDQVAGDIKAAA